MQVYVQWAQAAPADWQPVADHAWGRLPRLGLPAPGQVGDIADTAGWVYALNVQGVVFTGYDHYAVEPRPFGGCRVTCWKDDPDDYTPDAYMAVVWEFLPLAPDPRLGGAYNTRQQRTLYLGPAHLAYHDQLGPVEHTTILPWAAFRAPREALVRHGIWVTDALQRQQDAARTTRRWREWSDGVPDSLLVERDGVRMVTAQRPFGLYDKPKGTKTFYQNATDLANGIHVASRENQFGASAGASGTEVSGALGSGASLLTHLFTTLSTEPNAAAWPTGTYRCQLDVSAVGANLSYGLRTSGAVTGHFARVNSGLTSDLETKAQTQSLFTGTGLKLATTGNVSWSAGSASDRFECLVAASRPADHGNETLTLRYSADAFADGPWEAGQPRVKRVGGIPTVPGQVGRPFNTW